jgi:hypothetical protein
MIDVCRICWNWQCQKTKISTVFALEWTTSLISMNYRPFALQGPWDYLEI